MPRWIGSIALCCALVVLFGGCCKFDLFRRAERPSTLALDPRVGKPAPEIEGETFDGKQMKLSDHRGKVVVLVFWFSRCGPCKAMIPHERELLEKHQGKPFALLGVNNDEFAEEALAIMSAKKMTWPIWRTSGYFDDICKKWGVTRWPAVFVIDADGIVRFAKLSDDGLDAAVDTLLAEAADAAAKSR
jgi:thiol-disulfide isomerase/thioredoxin